MAKCSLLSIPTPISDSHRLGESKEQLRKARLPFPLMEMGGLGHWGGSQGWEWEGCRGWEGGGEGLLVETCGAGVSAWVEGFGLGPKRLLFIPSSL